LAKVDQKTEKGDCKAEADKKLVSQLVEVTKSAPASTFCAFCDGLRQSSRRVQRPLPELVRALALR
jgi:hypothetical protein